MKIYSRLALITSLSLVMGYAFVYAYTNLTLSDADSGKPLTSTLMQAVMGNVNELNTRVNSLASGWGNLWGTGASNSINYTAGTVGIGSTAGTNAELQIKSGTKPHWGVYQDETTEELRFWNGSNRVVFGSGGNVGIGTTIPTTALHVLQNGVGIAPSLTADNGVATFSTFTTPQLQIGGYPTSPYAMWMQVKRNFNDGNSYPLSIQPLGGNVGIGTANPGYRLEISENRADWATRIVNSNTNAYGLIVNNTSTSGTGFIFGAVSSGVYRLAVMNNGNVGIGTTSPQAKLHLHGTDINQVALMVGSFSSRDIGYLGNLQIGTLDLDGTTWSEKMRLDATGNVGIGTPSPSSTTGYSGPLLHLSGQQPAVILQNTSTSAAKWEIGTNWFGGANTPTLTMGVDGVYSMALQKGGNVGIGTTNPGVKLHVLGNNEMARFETTSDGANQYAQIAILAPGGANYIWSNNNNSPWYYGGNGALNIYTGQASPIAFFTNGSYQRMTIAGNGNVMINTTTDAGYKLDVNGSIRWTTVTPSDKNLKKNIQTLSGALDKIEELRGVTYEWKDSSKGSGLQIGVIAQEVEQVFPELVNTDKQGMKAVNYAALVAPLIEAVKEQQKQISALQAKVQVLENGR